MLMSALFNQYNNAINKFNLETFLAPVLLLPPHCRNICLFVKKTTPQSFLFSKKHLSPSCSFPIAEEVSLSNALSPAVMLV